MPALNIIVRICELKLGDVFLHYGIERKVRRIDETLIEYVNNSEHKINKKTISAKSQEKVMLISRKETVKYYLEKTIKNKI